MIFSSLHQTVDFISKYRNFYSIIRIWDNNHKKLLFENQNNDDTESNLVAPAVLYNATLSMSENGNTLTIEIPVTIDDELCCLELIQYRKDICNDSYQLMQKLSITDSLTNLYNRRYIDQQLPLDLDRYFHNDDPVSLIYADIDLFKKINDKYGHVTGDYILQETANVFKQDIRKKDGWIARYGGDEFLFCLPQIDQKMAIKIANRIRTSVENKNFFVGNNCINVTCSFAVETILKTSGIKTVNQVIELLDNKLYRAKSKGRNRVIL